MDLMFQLPRLQVPGNRNVAHHWIAGAGSAAGPEDRRLARGQGGARHAAAAAARAADSTPGWRGSTAVECRGRRSDIDDVRQPRSSGHSSSNSSSSQVRRCSRAAACGGRTQGFSPSRQPAGGGRSACPQQPDAAVWRHQHCQPDNCSFDPKSDMGLSLWPVTTGDQPLRLSSSASCRVPLCLADQSGWKSIHARHAGK